MREAIYNLSFIKAISTLISTDSISSQVRYFELAIIFDLVLGSTIPFQIVNGTWSHSDSTS